MTKMTREEAREEIEWCNKRIKSYEDLVSLLSVKQTEAKLNIEHKKDRIKELEKIINAPEWEPSGGEFYISTIGSIGCSDICVKDLTRFGNRFKSEAQAQKRLTQLEFQNLMFQLAEDLNEGWEPDWSDLKQEKAHIYYDLDSKKWRLSLKARHFNPSETYFDPNIVRKAIEIVKTWDCQMVIICEKCHEKENEERSEWRWRADYCKKNRLPPHQNWAWEKSKEAYKLHINKSRE